MPFWTRTEKSTQTPRASIASNKKLVSAEFNELTAFFNVNYQEFIDLRVLVENSGISLPYIRKDVDFNITSSGIYLFFGDTPRTFIIDDAIIGVVEIRTVSTAELSLSGEIHPNHMGVIYPETAATVFRWDDFLSKYTF